MLSLAEYQAYVNDITVLGQDTDQQIGDQIEGVPKLNAINQTKDIASDYVNQLKSIMDQALLDVASNSLHHYQQQLGQELPEDIIKDVVKDQYRHRYYNATLQQRFILMRLRLNRVATQTGHVGVQHLSGLFSKPFPFGAQTNVSKRLLQGTTIKVEQDVARKVADKTDTPFIRWTLSKYHIHTCQCEDYASRVDKKVTEYISKNQLDIEPEGLYFVDDLPDPPHPNCQCEFNLVGHDEEIVPGRGRRPFHKLRSLIRKLLRS